MSPAVLHRSAYSKRHATETVVAPVAANANAGAHGYLNTGRDMLALFIASGNGIKPGTKLGVIRNLDVAPTLARLLGVELKGVAGRPLSDILK
ncbi:MAG: hypothetical protein ACRD8O_04750 [Bryobacteraceae bacterium]